MTKKGRMVVWEIDVGRDPTSLVPVHAGIIPFHKNHVDEGTVPILESRVDVRTIHDHADMPTKVRIPYTPYEESLSCHSRTTLNEP